MNKLKLLILTPALLFFLTTNAQYKDLEGVFFGKVIAIGAGYSINGYADKGIGTQSAITAINYSVLINKKFITSSRLAFHKKFSLVYNGDDFGTPYSQTAEFKFIEYEAGLKFAITPDGTEKPTSVFFTVLVGGLFGKQKTFDSRYGETMNEAAGKIVAGAGLTLHQRVGNRFILYVEPAYRVVFEAVEYAAYLGDNQEKKIKLNHYTGQIGFLFLIGKSNK
jgi:hypothetical protein